MSAQRIARLTIAGWLMLPAAGWAQSATTGSIAGTVKDTTGAVLPGVTVEAASPALIEKTRAAVTDSQGVYKIADLRPGTYTVTFTLAGFSTFKRDGIELTTGFTATANAEMKVGSLEETVTVTGASPVVDVQNVRVQRVLSQETIDALPVGKAVQGLMAVTLGATMSSGGTQDVGGNQGDQPASIAFHGARGGEMVRKLDGMSVMGLYGNGGGPSVSQRISVTGVQEIVLETASSAENETGGVQLNYVPKEGSNRFSLYTNTSYTNSSLQGQNLTDELRARGITVKPSVKQLWDYGVGVGGPIAKDRLWFYSSTRWWGSQENQPGAYFNKTVGTLFYTPDLTRPGYNDVWTRDVGGRFTWQVSSKQRINVWETVQRNCRCFGDVSSTVSPEATINSSNGPNSVLQATWTYPATSRLLFQVRTSLGYFPVASPISGGATLDSIGVTELSTGLRYGARSLSLLTVNDYGDNKQTSNFNENYSMAYVTGSHSFKVGGSTMQGIHDMNEYITQSISYTFRSGLPVSLTQWASPEFHRVRLSNLALYAQDQWTRRRLTLNYGLRFDYFNGRTLADDVAAGRFVGARSFPAVKNVPNFRDLSPRLGAAYDLFGNGKTAIKGAVNRYVNSQGAGIAESAAPGLSIVSSATRTWSDANGNFVPDCDFQNIGASGECGALSNRLFGTSVINSTRAADVTNGFAVRDYNWQATAGIQHELRPGVALNVAYFRTWYGNLTLLQNTAVTAADFQPFCVTAPADAVLPGGGGNQICGQYDVNPAQFGIVNNLITASSNFGEQKEVFNGIDIGLNARFGAGGLLQGGVATSQTVTDNCFAATLPQLSATVQGGGAARQVAGFCRISPPWSAGTQVKLALVYPLPWWGLSASANYQNLPGIPILSNYVATNAQIAPSLGRNLSACPATGACTATATVALIPPSTMFENRLTQVDLRLTKLIRLGGTRRVRANFDGYNLFNASTILAENATYGASWRRPTSILGARLFKFGAEIDF